MDKTFEFGLNTRSYEIPYLQIGCRPWHQMQDPTVKLEYDLDTLIGTCILNHTITHTRPWQLIQYPTPTVELGHDFLIMTLPERYN